MRLHLLLRMIIQSKSYDNMEEEKKIKDPRGGSHGGGRPRGDRNIPLCVRITPEANERLQNVKNKSEYINNLILEQ